MVKKKTKEKEKTKMICHVSLEAVYTHTSNCLENKEKINIKKT